MNFSRPDGFYGSMLAAESIIDGVTILHGPGGCRGLSAALSSRHVPREYRTVEGDFFFHRSRIPCTHVDIDDYIYGASAKVGMVLDILKSDRFGFACILESPGASLIGDKLQDEVIQSGLSDKVAILGKCMMSETFATGYDAMLRRIAEKLAVRKEKKRGMVNLVGLPFIARGCFPLVAELHRLLGMMGLTVNADIGMACTIQQMRDSGEAVANVCICPEYFSDTAEYYESIGVPTVRGPLGAPIGYDAIRAWVLAVADATGADPSAVMEYIDREEKDVFRVLTASLGLGEFMRYRLFSVLAESSVALPLTRFMVKELKLMPRSVNLTEHDGDCEGKLKDILERIHAVSALETEFGKDFADVVFGPGSYGDYLKETEMCSTNVDIFLPTKEKMDIFPKSIIGLDGCRRIVEYVMNSM